MTDAVGLRPVGRSHHWKLARFELWLAALYCGLAGCWQVFKPMQLDDGGWSVLSQVEPANGMIWWAAALILGAAAQFANVRLVAPIRVMPSPATVEAPARWPLLLAALPYVIAVVTFYQDRTFTVPVMIGWIGAIVTVTEAFAPVFRPWKWIRHGGATFIRFLRDRTAVSFALGAVFIVAVGARLYEIETAPPDMSVPQVQKLLAVQRIADGELTMFFPSDGREPLHSYLLVALSPLTGGVNRTALHLTAIVESVAGIAALYVLGVAVIGDGSRRAHGFGLLVALMGAVGYWHIVTTRVALRIMLTPLFTSLLLWALIRLIRHNRRADAVWAGAIIGVGFYGYQALRLLPAIGLLAVLIGLFWRTRPWAERRKYLSHLCVMMLVATAITLPLLRYALDRPDEFWGRAIEDVTGDCYQCQTAFGAVQRIAENVQKLALMFTYRGDNEWAYNAPSYPALDPLAGALMLGGLGAFVVWGRRRRDPALLLLLGAFVVPLLPSAISIALPQEVPSSTQTSGAMPVVYLLVAFGLAAAVDSLAALLHPRYRRLTLLAAPAAALFMLSYSLTVVTGPYTRHFENVWVSQREVATYMQSLIDEGIGWGNIYLVNGDQYHIFFHAVMLEAGHRSGDFPDSYAHLRDLPERLYKNWLSDAATPLDSSRDLVFVYTDLNTTITPALTKWFPGGTAQRISNESAVSSRSSFNVYRVPAPGDRPLIQMFRANLDPSALQ